MSQMCVWTTVSPPFLLTVLKGAGQRWRRPTAKKLQEFWPNYQTNAKTYKTKVADDNIFVFILKVKYHSLIVGWYKMPECCWYCGKTPQEAISKTKEKDAVGVKLYIDIWCEMALPSILCLLGQQRHQDPHRNSFPISCWFITGIAVALLFNEKLWACVELLSRWRFMFLCRWGSHRDQLSGALNHQPSLLISYPQHRPFHFTLPQCWLKGEVVNSLVEVGGGQPEHNFSRFVSHLSN